MQVINNNEEISYVCPVCKNLLQKKEFNYVCLNCSLEFSVIKKNGLELINFNTMLAKTGNCECIVDGKTQCKIDMQQLIANANSGIYSYKSRVSKYLMKYCNSGNKILDLGCRYGENGACLSEKNMVIGLDICPESIVSAYVNPNIKYKSLVINNGIDLPFPDEYFDIVVALEVIEH